MNKDFIKFDNCMYWCEARNSSTSIPIIFSVFFNPLNIYDIIEIIYGNDKRGTIINSNGTELFDNLYVIPMDNKEFLTILEKHKYDQQFNIDFKKEIL